MQGSEPRKREASPPPGTSTLLKRTLPFALSHQVGGMSRVTGLGTKRALAKLTAHPSSTLRVPIMRRGAAKRYDSLLATTEGQ